MIHLKAWKQQGIDRFTTHCNTVKAHHKFTSNAKFEEGFQLYCRSQWLGKQSNGDDKNSNDNTEETAAYNDLEDMDDKDVAAPVAI